MKVMLEKIKKRPCRICRKWFTPNNKLKERQKTCGKPECKKEWHKRVCAKFNKKNNHYFRSNYMQTKIDAAIESEKMGQNDCQNYNLPVETIINVFSPHVNGN
jgi:hypothetical protein